MISLTLSKLSRINANLPCCQCTPSHDDLYILHIYIYVYVYIYIYIYICASQDRNISEPRPHLLFSGDLTSTCMCAKIKRMKVCVLPAMLCLMTSDDTYYVFFLFWKNEFRNADWQSKTMNLESNATHIPASLTLISTKCRNVLQKCRTRFKLPCNFQGFPNVPFKGRLFSQTRLLNNHQVTSSVPVNHISWTI